MLSYKGYVGRLEWDENAAIYHGTVDGITDVVTFEGVSQHEAEHAFRESVDDYLAMCAERGESPQPPSSGSVDNG